MHVSCSHISQVHIEMVQIRVKHKKYIRQPTTPVGLRIAFTHPPPPTACKYISITTARNSIIVLMIIDWQCKLNCIIRKCNNNKVDTGVIGGPTIHIVH